MDKVSKAFYSAQEVAHMLGISPQSIYTYCREGILPSLRLGKRVVIPIDKFNALLKEGGVLV